MTVSSKIIKSPTPVFLKSKCPGLISFIYIGKAFLQHLLFCVVIVPPILAVTTLGNVTQTMTVQYVTWVNKASEGGKIEAQNCRCLAIKNTF
jgi:hypothetical protein